MQASSEYSHMNNLSCHDPTGNVLGIYILSSRALGEPSQQSYTWHILSPCPFAQSKATAWARKTFVRSWYIVTRWENKRSMSTLTTSVRQRSAAVEVKRKGDGPYERLHTHALASHNDSSVYSRQFSFLPTIMMEIEFQEMFIFLSIRPNNNNIPTGLKKHLSSKDCPEN